MSIEDTLLQLLSDFRVNLDNHKEQLRCFCNKGVQVEGWLKGEMLFFLTNEVKKKIISDFDREVWIKDEAHHGKRSIIDLKIVGNSKESAYVELKHWLIGYQKKTLWKASSYLSDNSSVGISLDAKKLEQISKIPNYVLILATANPGTEDWNVGVEKFNKKFAPVKSQPLTYPADFPEEYFVGLLRVTTK